MFVENYTQTGSLPEPTITPLQLLLMFMNSLLNRSEIGLAPSPKAQAQPGRPRPKVKPALNKKNAG